MANGGQQAPAKKGLPVWAWVGIGCGVIAVFVMIALTVGGVLLANKAKDMVAEFEEDPAMATAQMIVKLNPELEEVSSDSEAGTITVRNKKTGEEITVNFDDIEKGQFSFKTGDREVTIDASDLEGGNVKVTDGEGEVVYSAGKVSGDVPGWVPMPEGAEPTNQHMMTAGEESSGGFEIATDSTVAEILDFYTTSLEAAGYEVKINTYSQEGTEGGMVNGSNGEGRNVVAIVNSEGGGPTKVVVNFSER
jgi:hypothetical protein